MFTVLVVFVAAALVLVTLFASAIFLRAAFLRQGDIADDTKDTVTWRPAFMRGDALRNWAARTAERISARRLNGERSADTAVQIVTELEAGALHAMMPLAHQSELERVIPCPETGQGTVGVTAVEVLAIAADLRKKQSPAELEHIHHLALRNAAALAAQTSHDPSLPPLPCPLQGKHQVCCAYAARPLRCRPLHAVAVAKNMGTRRVDSPDDEGGTPRSTGHEETVAQGIELGLMRALRSTHLDANTYELNSALAKALETPDASERWARGESVFETCLRVELTTDGRVVSRHPFDRSVALRQ